MTRRKTNAIILTTGALILVILLSFVLFDNTKQSSQAKITPVVSKPTSTNGKLTPKQRAQVVAIITANTNHYKKLWLEGQAALSKQNSSDFSTYTQTENPANDNSMNDAFKQADAIYPSNVGSYAIYGSNHIISLHGKGRI
ncbi:MAG: hypothetical protein ACR2LN_03540 [Candidatus Levyibacteriota bacterium]